MMEQVSRTERRDPVREWKNRIENLLDCDRSPAEQQLALVANPQDGERRLFTYAIVNPLHGWPGNFTTREQAEDHFSRWEKILGYRFRLDWEHVEAHNEHADPDTGETSKIFKGADVVKFEPCFFENCTDAATVWVSRQE